MYSDPEDEVMEGIEERAGSPGQALSDDKAERKRKRLKNDDDEEEDEEDEDEDEDDEAGGESARRKVGILSQGAAQR